MACKVCSSENQQKFPVELAVVFPGVQRFRLSPVYVCQEMLICLSCGHSESIVPATELEKLRTGMNGHHASDVRFIAEYSRLQ